MKTIETTMAAVLAALFTPLSFAEPGDFIPTFGSGGVATADFGASSRLLGAAQMDSLGTNVAVGRVGAAPGVNDFALAFFGPDGVLLNSFDSDGLVTTDLGGNDSAICAVVRSGGVTISDPAALIVAGHTDNGMTSRFVHAYYHPADGSLITTFGSGGIVATNFGASVGLTGMALSPDGELLLVGIISTSGGSDFAVARYTRSGTLDPSFGTGGKLVADMTGGDDFCDAVAVQSNGKILVGGAGDGKDFLVARFDSGGMLDPNFGASGKTVVNFPGLEAAHCLAIRLLPDERILASGIGSIGIDSFVVLTRLLPNGRLDPTFGSGGRVVRLGLVSVEDVAVHADGRILVTGQVADPSSSNSDFGVMRFKANGSIDPTFGIRGRTHVDLGSTSENASRVFIQPDGTIAVFGTSKRGGSYSNFQMITLRGAQADARIGTRANAPRGNDLYNRTAAGQTQSTPLLRGRPKTLFAGFQNDGAVPDALSVRGTRGTRKITASYFSGRRNVTGLVTQGRFLTGTLPPTAMSVLKVKLKTTTPLPRQRLRLSMTSISKNDTTGWDVTRIDARKR